MSGDEKIGVTMDGTNSASAPFADVINKLVKKADRDWAVQFDTGNPDKASRFVASNEDVTLILNPSDTAAITGDAIEVYYIEGGVLVKYEEFKKSGPTVVI